MKPVFYLDVMRYRGDMLEASSSQVCIGPIELVEARDNYETVTSKTRIRKIQVKCDSDVLILLVLKIEEVR